MLQRIYDFFCRKITRHSFLNDDDLRLYMMLYVALVFIAVVYLALIILYSLAGIPALIVMYSGGLLICLSTMILLKKKLYSHVGVILSLLAVVCTLIAIFFVGIGSYIVLYFFMIALMQIVIPYGRIRIRVTIVCLLWLGIIFCAYAEHFFSPIYVLGDGAVMSLTLLNLNVGFFAAIIELSITNVVNGIIEHLHKKRVKELEGQVYTDLLTGLYNRRYMERFIESELRAHPNKSWCVAMLDIDDFKMINDNYGHYAGDLVLKNFAAEIRNNLRKTDVVFRWGGEEFLLFLENVDIKAAYAILEKLRLNITCHEIIADNQILKVTTTIGVCELELNDIDAGIGLCDSKMYIGKKSGKNVIIA